MKMTHTNRGFAKIEVADTRGCICRVQRSSAACVDAVWIFCDDPKGVYLDGKPSPHLDADQAREVARALLAFADHADDIQANPAVRGDSKAGVPCTGVVGSLNQEDGK